MLVSSLVGGLAAVETESYKLPSINRAWQGTWINQAFVDSYQAELNLDVALQAMDPVTKARPQYNVLVVEANKITVTGIRASDTGMVSASVFQGFRLGGTAAAPTLLDPSGASYVRLSTNVRFTADKIAENWVGQVLARAIESKGLSAWLMVSGATVQFKKQILATTFSITLHQGKDNLAASALSISVFLSSANAGDFALVLWRSRY